MTYICPVCKNEFSTTEDWIVKHYLSCWKERNPCHQSKEAPKGEDVVTRQVDAATLNFFASYGKG